MAKENNIEWILGQDKATAYFTQGRFITQIKKLAEERPDDVRIMDENQDGSILAQFPVGYVKLRAPRILTEEQKEEMAERAKRHFGHG